MFFIFNDRATTEIYTLSLHTLFRSSGAILGGSRPSARHLAADHRPISEHGCRVQCPEPHGLFEFGRSEEHTSELQSQSNLVCRLLLEKKNISRLLQIIKYHHL